MVPSAGAAVVVTAVVIVAGGGGAGMVVAVVGCSVVVVVIVGGGTSSGWRTHTRSEVGVVEVGVGSDFRGCEGKTVERFESELFFDCRG